MLGNGIASLCLWTELIQKLFNYMERLEHLSTHPEDQMQARMPYEISFY